MLKCACRKQKTNEEMVLLKNLQYRDGNTMNSAKRLLRKPLLTLIWILLVAVMTGFLAVGSSMFFSTRQLAKTLDSSHTAIAVRSDPAAYITYVDGAERSFVYDDRSFTFEDKELLESFPSVKAVRSHTLTGGTSPSFTPYIAIRKNLSWRSEGPVWPYWNIVIAGRICASKIQDENTLVFGLEFGDAYLAGSEFSEALNAASIGGLTVYAEIEDFPEAVDYFKKGEYCVLSGMYEPGDLDHYNTSLVHGYDTYFCHSIRLGHIKMQDGVVMGTPFGSEYMQAKEGEYEPYSFPACEIITDRLNEEEDGTGRRIFDADTFFETTEHDVWREYKEKWELQAHSLPVIGTDNLDTVYAFFKEKAEIIEGRGFTEEEYEQGARVMVVSDRIAKAGGLSVGDKITMRQFRTIRDDSELEETENTDQQTNDQSVVNQGDSYTYEVTMSLNNPAVDMLDMNRSYTDEEEFTLVGVYHLTAEWSNTAFSFTPNTVFIPSKAQIEGGYGAIKPEPKTTYDLYGIFLTIELNNGKVDEFGLAINDTKFKNQFFTFDQGYEDVQKNANDLAVSSKRIMILSAIGWAMFLPLFLILFQGAQSKNIGIMRSLGNRPARTGAYLFVSGMLVVIVGVALGTFLSSKVLDAVQGRILTDAIAGLDRNVSPAALEMAEQNIKTMVEQSALPLKALVIIGLLQLAAFTLPVLIQSIVLSNTPPRRLKG